MLMKSLAISLVAALLGPTIGVGVFLLTNGDRFGGETTLPIRAAGPLPESDQAEVIRTFAQPRLWLCPATGALESSAKTPAAHPSSELAAWRTVVTRPTADVTSAGNNDEASMNGHLTRFQAVSGEAAPNCQLRFQPDLNCSESKRGRSAPKVPRPLSPMSELGQNQSSRRRLLDLRLALDSGRNSRRSPTTAMGQLLTFD